MGFGYTAGNILPIEPITFKELKQWAKELHDDLLSRLLQCGGCGEVMWDEDDVWTVDNFCSEACAEDVYEAILSL